MSTKVILVDASKISQIIKLSGVDGLDALVKRGDKFFFSDDARRELNEGGGLSRENQARFDTWLDAQDENGRVATVSPITTEDERDRFDPNMKRLSNRGGDEIWDMSARKFMTENPDFEFEVISDDKDFYKNISRSADGNKPIVDQEFEFTSLKKAMVDLTYHPSLHFTEEQFTTIKDVRYGSITGLRQGDVKFPKTYKHSLESREERSRNPAVNPNVNQITTENSADNLGDENVSSEAETDEPQHIVPKRPGKRSELEEILRGNNKYKNIVSNLVKKGIPPAKIVHLIQTFETVNELIKSEQVGEAQELLTKEASGILGGVLGALTAGATTAILFPEPITTVGGSIVVFGVTVAGSLIGTNAGEFLGEELLLRLGDASSKGGAIPLEKFEEISENVGDEVHRPDAISEDGRDVNQSAPVRVAPFGVPLNPKSDHIENEVEKGGGKADLKAEAPTLNVDPGSIRMAAASPIAMPPTVEEQALRADIHKLRAQVSYMKSSVTEAERRSRHSMTPRRKPKKPTANLGLAFNHLKTANNRYA